VRVGEAFGSACRKADAVRLEALTGKLDRTLVVSADIAGMTSHATEELGSYALKGVPAPVGVFAPRR
jgi:class 3 adenylate cyclase